MKVRSFIAASVLLAGGYHVNTASAEPMEYVRVCDAYGTNYYYSPGTETCINADTGATRQDTIDGTVAGETKLAARVSDIESRINDAFDGASIAASLVAPSLAAGEHAGVRINWGNAGNANAFGVSGALVLHDNAFDKGVRLTGSAGIGFTSNKVGGNAGLQATW